jgi:hypothetical protein
LEGLSSLVNSKEKKIIKKEGRRRRGGESLAQKKEEEVKWAAAIWLRRLYIYPSMFLASPTLLPRAHIHTHKPPMFPLKSKPSLISSEMKGLTRSDIHLRCSSSERGGC